MHKSQYLVFSLSVLLSLAGCASHEDAPRPPMTQAEAQQQMQDIAADPHMTQTARDAAQHGLDEGQAKQMLEQGK